MNAQVGTAFIKFHNYHVIIEELAEVKLCLGVFLLPQRLCEVQCWV